MEILIHSEHIQTIGILLGITTITLVHGATEVTTILGVTDMIRGTMVVTMEDITIHGITDTTLGTMADGITVGMVVFMIHTITTCIHTIADGTEDGIHTSEEFITGLISEADMELSWAEAARMYTEAHAMKQLPTE